MAGPGDLAKGAAGAIGGGAAGAGAAVATGLVKAEEVAGDVLRGIFGGLPWEMSASGIVDAVAGGAGSSAGAFVVEIATSGVIG